jgi:hypothetical protein
MSDVIDLDAYRASRGDHPDPKTPAPAASASVTSLRDHRRSRLTETERAAEDSRELAARLRATLTGCIAEIESWQPLAPGSPQFAATVTRLDDYRDPIDARLAECSRALALANAAVRRASGDVA